VDNIRAIFLAGKRNSGYKSKHINIKNHYVRDLIDKGLIDVKVKRPQENLANSFMKNLKGELYELCASKLLTEWNSHRKGVG
jgi:hypothetical protein